MKDEGQHLVIKYVFLFFKRLKLLWRVTNRDGHRLLYWPITYSSFDHITLCYLQTPLSTSGSGPEVLNRKPLRVAEDRCPQQGALRDCKLALTQALTNSNWKAGIYIYYFIRLQFLIDHVIFVRLSTLVRLWLTAWSWVNMQELFVVGRVSLPGRGVYVF